jgi:hypothetical protein
MIGGREREMEICQGESETKKKKVHWDFDGTEIALVVCQVIGLQVVVRLLFFFADLHHEPLFLRFF